MNNIEKKCAQCGREMENESCSQGAEYFCTFDCFDNRQAQKRLEKCTKQVPLLFALAEDAKNVQEYRIANVAFTYVLEWFLSDPPCGEWDVYLETEDPTGSYENVYYDILHIACKMGDMDADMCIPAPLVDAYRLVRLMKHGVATCERRSHNREVVQASPEYVDSLYDRLVAILPEEHLIWERHQRAERRKA